MTDRPERDPEADGATPAEGEQSLEEYMAEQRAKVPQTQPYDVIFLDMEIPEEFRRTEEGTDG